MSIETQILSGPQESARELAERFLTFNLAGEEYGIEITRVREIIGLLPITKVPTASENCRGVINLRGKVIPILDLRLKFGMQAKEDTSRTCFVIVDLSGAQGQSHVGLVVDEVAEVLDIPQADLSPPPDYGSGLDTTLIHGIGVVAGELKILLDIDQVLSGEVLPDTEA